jgi:hypothetical protein
MSAHPVTVRDVLIRLKGEGLLREHDNDAAAAILSAQKAEHETPWFVRGLVAVSAWIAALLFLIFLFGTRIVSSSGGGIVLGAVACAGAVVLRRFRGANLFTNQLALALSLSGQVLLIGGIDDKSSAATASKAAILLNAALIGLYPDKTHRFLSTLICVFAAMTFIYEQHLMYGTQALAVALAAGAGYLWREESGFAAGGLADLSRPIGYGVVVGLLSVLVPSLFPHEFRTYLPPVSSWIPATVGLALLLVHAEWRILSVHGVLSDRRLSVPVFAGTVLLALASLQAPGIIAALFVLVLGFHRGNRIVMGLSLAFLGVFLSAYYYNMEMTLLRKSFVLMVTGAILLALRFFLVGRLSPQKEDR